MCRKYTSLHVFLHAKTFVVEPIALLAPSSPLSNDFTHSFHIYLLSGSYIFLIWGIIVINSQIVGLWWIIVIIIVVDW
ncbi:hypothetical protein RJT34_25650 [Clitoria ternatea]|uniref:Uncharacterized protein n=1 Tax=Clitoria ternatea TaxID=43366 RepID=A0AAN9ILH0_CLITE